MSSPALEALYDELVRAYRARFARSDEQHARSRQVMVDGGQHTLRLHAPYPIHIRAAQGAYIDDLDGHHILDFWQGHFANILGHNPPQITAPLAATLSEGYGLQTGMVDEWAYDLATLLCQQSGAERVRFTTSGSLATMYAIMLSRSYTGRQQVLKVGGGWHGAQPWGLIGVSYNGAGYQSVESEGLPGTTAAETLVTRFNDVEALEQVFARHGDQIACFIVEPVVGAAGGVPGKPAYIQRARELTEHYGALLILDEVIAGFRFRAGNVGRLYGVTPDLTTYGKVIGGGMPVAAVAGRADVLTIAGREGGRRVRFDGGTYSAHPASMLAGKLMLSYLIEHEEEVYGYLARLGEQVRARLEHIFAAHGILARCSGYPNAAIPGSSLAMVHFTRQPGIEVDCPNVAADPSYCLADVRERIFKLALLLEDVHAMHGLGALSMAHGERDLAHLYAACERVAARFSGPMSEMYGTAVST
ncbi:MAG: aminotransferase class III-fold pyridoxal phosphate-dependent enzyme [Anaerolineae bacterium]|nr:aminotransferase class III-fold pyridoxal phosphate-dependent enzyme [Anaerolineae bacterium]